MQQLAPNCEVITMRLRGNLYYIVWAFLPHQGAMKRIFRVKII